MTMEEALEYRKNITSAAQLQPDEAAMKSKWMYEKFENGMIIKGGNRYQFGGNLYRCILPDGTERKCDPGWNPENAPSLFTKVLPGQDGASVGEWEQPDSTNPYRAGERVMHNGVLWISEMDDNVWEPGVYGWQKA